MAADIGRQVTSLQVAATTTSGATPIFLGGVKTVIIRSLSQDVYVDFDQPVATTTSYRIASSNTADTTVSLNQGLIRNLYVQAVTGTTQVYIISIVG